MSLPIDEGILDALREKVRVEDEANRLKQQELTLLKRRQAVFEAVFERYAGVGERASSLIVHVEASLAESKLRGEALREYFDDLADRIQELADRLDLHGHVLILLLTEQAGDEKQAATETLYLIHERREREKILERYRANLQKLREREARYGAGAAPVSLLNEIEETERKIEELEAK